MGVLDYNPWLYIVFLWSLFQTAALVAVTNVSEYLDETSIRRMVLPKMKTVYEKNATDLKIVGNILSCVEKTLDRLERQQIIDEVLPLLWDVRLQDPDITLRVVSKWSDSSMYIYDSLSLKVFNSKYIDFFKLNLLKDNLITWHNDVLSY